ncbi:Y-family DNA polymerase [Devosia rhizoryzae]|uniref:DNA-directed DNA polymerase n=1 Tax=Devosia rhizoryzae TaxID=2774137 RepID=A0ABX7C5W0_9HYPH|nr:DNA polymerase Y family protein [Devosia rhizoryzae]QQR39163.1 DNA polymerase Y family protein [Devosia rhizoryzae]
MASQSSRNLQTQILGASQRRFLALNLPYWPIDYLKRADPALRDKPLALYEHIKGGLRLAALDPMLLREGLRIGQNLADARAIEPHMVVQEIDRLLLKTAFEAFADWHSNASPLVSVLTDREAFGDLVLDITGVAHLFGGERSMLRLLLTRLRDLGYSVSGAIAPTIGAAWGISHFAKSQIVEVDALESCLDVLPVAALRLNQNQISTFSQMGITTIAEVRRRSRKQLQARFGAGLLIRLDQAYGEIEERMSPRLPQVDHHVDRRLAEPISLMDDVLRVTRDLADQLCTHLESEGLGAQSFHLFLYRVDHKVMPLSLNAARLTRDPQHIFELFRHHAQRIEAEYDPGFGIDMVRLAASSLEALGAVQTGAFSIENGSEDIDRLNDRLASRLGAMAVLQTEMVASRLPERAARLVPTLASVPHHFVEAPPLRRPLRLLPVPERVAITAEVPDGLPAAMVWRQQTYRLRKGEGPERLGAEWWRKAERLKLVEQTEPKKPEPGEKQEPPPYIPNLPQFVPDADTRDYYVVEDQEGRRFWVFRQGFYSGDTPPLWYLHGFFS